MMRRTGLKPRRGAVPGAWGQGMLIMLMDTSFFFTENTATRSVALNTVEYNENRWPTGRSFSFFLYHKDESIIFGHNKIS